MKDSKFLKQFLAFVLSAAMVLTYMPMSMIAFAEDGAAEAASSEPKAAAAEEVKSEPEPAPAPKAEEPAPAPAAEEPAPLPQQRNQPLHLQNPKKQWLQKSLQKQEKRLHLQNTTTILKLQ